MKFDIFNTDSAVLLDTFADPDENIFNQNNLNVNQLDAKYCTPEGIKHIKQYQKRNHFQFYT